jgi:poly(glycerol-phosphate) alpha-glucosyltransferase
MGRDKFDFLASCDVFIHPSRWEAGVPFSVLDALELARPCLVSSGSFFNFFQQHAAGMQVPPTKEGIAEGLQYMAKASAERLDAMGCAGRLAVLQEFSWQRTAQKLLQAYARRPTRLSQQDLRSDVSAVA